MTTPPPHVYVIDTGFQTQIIFIEAYKHIPPTPLFNFLIRQNSWLTTAQTVFSTFNLKSVDYPLIRDLNQICMTLDCLIPHLRTPTGKSLDCIPQLTPWLHQHFVDRPTVLLSRGFPEQALPPLPLPERSMKQSSPLLLRNWSFLRKPTNPSPADR